MTTLNTIGTGTQTVSLTAISVNVDGNLGIASDNLELTATTGNISGASTITANNLTLTADAAGASIGTAGVSPWGAADLSGVLTASAQTGAGGICLATTSSNLTFASIQSDTGNIELVVDGDVNGNDTTPNSFNDDDMPVFTYGENLIEGGDTYLEADTIGLTGSPVLNVNSLKVKALQSGDHPSPTIGTGWSTVISVPDPEGTGGSKWAGGEYPVPAGNVDISHNVQVGKVKYFPSGEIDTGSVLATAAGVMSPQQAALEELLSGSGGEDFFMAPPLWIDIEMGEEEEEEFEGEEGFTSLQQPYFYGSPDLKNMRNMPTLLGGLEKEDLLRLSSLR
ncbi:MAG: hypothetical protein JRI43_03430 [Deltaproteobacteria bacterium]|nr:hypothetical protein [Deltaproteobacteria bacterium]